MNIERLDHLVLTVTDIERSCRFYQQVLGFDVVTFRDDRKALAFGHQKINLHQAGHEFEPKAHQPTPGSADLCFLAATPLAEVIEELNDLGVIIEEGPVERTGAGGPIVSVYLRDPDNNLIEIANSLPD
ncbi:VOC family protein [Serratia ficaria]|uniref:Virulence protein STM3117 n=1 Tax=Serratia ficaria TaxID=61651 RepID=A0A240CAS0_SERFI|nr:MULTISPECIES: VOC family protein [Serratia]MEE4484745.1 VOC family protein [Serratia ficaria]REF43439.1 catechol 2,3-dioxygenase-like lactoylglutathione lyase family enzyme [Serratia ficaria]CAI0696049.1 Virulence protein STM3117 [Serratia ficaria]CAI1114056.1 Virulence protein STM3117 [Serratia ficaria]CAI1128746.1 Virulence protein STM3117 [Serratia ficaria]